MRSILSILSVLVLSLFFPLGESNYSAAQLQMVTYGLEENNLILRTISTTVLNFGDEEDRKLYKRCIQHYIESQILFVEKEFGKSYLRLRHTQFLLIVLYERLLSKNISSLRSELNRLGYISRGNEKLETRSYLELGFRELARAEQKYIFAKNTRPALYLLKLRELLFGIKTVKQAGKFVILLGLLHDSKYPPIYEDTNFDKLKYEIQRVIFNDREKYLRIHYDNHFKALGGTNLYEAYWDKPDLPELAAPLGKIDPGYVRRDPPLEIKKN